MNIQATRLNIYLLRYNFAFQNHFPQKDFSLLTARPEQVEGSHESSTLLKLIGIIALMYTTLSLASVPNIDNYLRPQFPFEFRLSGFTRTDFFYDSRQSVGFSENTLLLAPAKPLYRVNCCDINGTGRCVLSPLINYVRLGFHGLEVAGAHISGALQISGGSGIFEDYLSAFSLWYGYFTLQRSQEEFSMGQMRHPLRLLEVWPRSFAFNSAEIPSAPQLRWTHTFAQHYRVITTVYSELVDSSFGQLDNGLIVPSPIFIQNSMKPGVAFRFQSDTPRYIYGAGVAVRSLVPRAVTATGYATNESIGAIWFTTFIGWYSEAIEIRYTTLIGQNLSSSAFLGGVALSRCASVSNDCSYTNLWAATNWLDIEFTRHPIVHPGMFFSYSPVFHVDGPLYIDPSTQQPVVYTFDDQLQSVMKASFRVTADWEPLKMGIEFLYARAVYGTMDRQGNVHCKQPVGLGRLRFVTWWYF